MSKELTLEQLDELEEFHSLASTGPWRVGNWIEDEEGPKLHLIYSQPRGQLDCLIARTCFAPQSHQNATLISEMQEKLPVLISMARQSLQLQERLGKATRLLEEVFEDGLKTNNKQWNREVNEFLGGPKAIRSPQPATPPVEPDVLPVCTRCHGRGGWEGGFAGETWTECPECN